MGLSGTVCFAPCARAIDTEARPISARLIRMKAGIRNEKRGPRLGMMKLIRQYGKQTRTKQCKSAGNSRQWTTSGKSRLFQRAPRTCVKPVQSVFQDCFSETDGHAYEICFPHDIGGMHCSEHDLRLGAGKEKLSRAAGSGRGRFECRAAGDRGQLPEEDWPEGEAFVRGLRRSDPADSEWRSVRSVFLG